MTHVRNSNSWSRLWVTSFLTALVMTSSLLLQPPASAGTSDAVKQIQAELRASLKIKTLPTVVNPPSSKWADLWNTDFGQITTGGGNSSCWDVPKSSSTLPTCEFGDRSATRTLVLTGDSQAWMWEPAFNLWGQRSQWRVIVLTKGSCQPWPDPNQEYFDNSAFPECHVFQNNVRNYVNSTHPQVVVAAGLGPAVANPSISTYKKDVANFVDSIAPSGAKVLLVSPSTSWYNYDYTNHSTLGPPTCLSIHPNELVACDGIPLKSLLNYYMNGVLDEGNLPGNSQLLDLNKLLCTSKCPMIAAGTLIYVDDDHVSYDWAVHASSALGELLAPFLKGL